MSKYLLGIDLGSSAVKVSLLDVATGKPAGSASAPSTDMLISAPRPGWAEQDPQQWWAELVAATTKLREATGYRPEEIAAVGIAYQMHGLVCLGHDGQVLRPAILWCDSRAVQTGARASEVIGDAYCQRHLFNSPGNFTAAKLGWVRDNEPAVFAKVARILLPGEWLAFRLTGRAVTTASGLSEGVFWDFAANTPAAPVLDWLGIDTGCLGEILPTFGHQGAIQREAAEALGLAEGTPVSYRAGDQPNNALSLGALDPGEIAATCGTSGVVYAVGDQPCGDSAGRWNVFAHVSHTVAAPRYGALLCLNGAGSSLRWLRHQFAAGGTLPEYAAMDAMAAGAVPGGNGLSVFPFGNGAERMLGNRNPGAAIHGIDFNRHGPGDLVRATLEGIAFALADGLLAMREAGVPIARIRAGRANVFLSPVFRATLAAVAGVDIALYETDGSIGAARGAGVGIGVFPSLRQAMAGLDCLGEESPDPALAAMYAGVFATWRARVHADC